VGMEDRVTVIDQESTSNPFAMGKLLGTTASKGNLMMTTLRRTKSRRQKIQDT